MAKTKNHRKVLLITLLSLVGVFQANRIPAETNVWSNSVGTADHSSNVISITDDGNTLLVVNPDSNSISLVGLGTQTTVNEIPVGVDPRAIAIDETRSRAYVANRGSDSISVVDLVTRQLFTEVAVGDRPVGISVSPDDQFVVVAEFGDDQVRFLDATDLDTLSISATSDRPHGMVFTPNGRHLLVTHLLSGNVTVLNVQPFGIFLPLIFKPGSTQHVFKFASQDSRHTIISTWPNVAPAPAVIVNAAGTRGYLPQTMAHGQGLNTQFDNTVFPKVSVLNLETWSHQTSEHIPLPEIDQPVGLPWSVALAYDDSELWVVNSASNDVSVIDISDETRPSYVAHITVGNNPRGIVISPDGSTAYVNNTLSGTISVLDTQNYTTTEVIKVTDIPLPPILMHGKMLFHSSARPDLAQARWISCNTCHIEGEHDGRTWTLQFTGEIPISATPVITRNTTSLLGMIETYPLRWSAEWDESADSEFSIRFEQFGTGLIDDDMHPTLGLPNQGRSYDLDCLAAFIDSLSVSPRTHKLTLTEQRGKAIFESAETACAKCHPAPLYTDLQVHDVGTADAYGEWFGPLIDTPTLRFLYDSAPYLHDGSAATLRDVLNSANPNDKHGVTSHLSEQEIEDLVAFLLALPFE